MTLDEYETKIFNDNHKVKEEFTKLGPLYEIISDEIKARHEIGMKQKELAEKMGTTQSNISRFESGCYNPSLMFLQKMASSLGKTLKVSFD